VTVELKGIIPPMVTPFTAGGDLDEAALRAEVRYVLDQGVHGPVNSGSSGEAHGLSLEELCHRRRGRSAPDTRHSIPPARARCPGVSVFYTS
jgi:hypothetical protein